LEQLNYYSFPLIDKISMQNIFYNNISNIICNKFDIPENEIFEKNRKRKYINARCCMFFILRVKHKLKLLDIQNMTGYNYSTIIHSVQNYKTFIKYDKYFRDKVESIIINCEKKL